MYIIFCVFFVIFDLNKDMNKINKMTYKFKNPEVESNFLDHNWKTQSKISNNWIVFTIVIMEILNIIPEFFERTSNSNLIGL